MRPAHLIALLALPATLAALPARADGGPPGSGVYCRDSGRSIFAFKKNADGSLEYSATSNTPSGDSVLSFAGRGSRTGENRWASRFSTDDPEDKCALAISFTGSAWTVVAKDFSKCEGHHGAHGPYEMPTFPVSSFKHPVGGPLVNEDCAAPKDAGLPAKPGQQGVGTSDPAGVVKGLVAQDTGGWGKIFAEKPTPTMRQYFTDGFNASWAKAMTHNQDEPVLDGDPITGYQMVERVKPAATTGGQTGPDTGRVVATLRVTSEGKTKSERVTFDLKLENQHWKIDDITSGSMPSLRAYFRKNYGA